MIKDDDDDQSVGYDKTEPDTWRHQAGAHCTALPGPGHGDTVTIHRSEDSGDMQSCSPHAVLMQYHVVAACCIVRNLLIRFFQLR